GTDRSQDATRACRRPLAPDWLTSTESTGDIRMSLRPATRTLRSLTGVLVVAFALWALLNFVYAPSCGRFSCSYVPSWWPQAQADTDTACPDSVTGAAGDASWAADRIASIADEKITTGLLYDADGAQHKFVSA